MASDNKYLVKTRYLGEHADLKRLQERVTKYRYLGREHPLILEVADKAYAVITKFGTITLWNVDEKLEKELVKDIMPFIVKRHAKYDYRDFIDVYAGAEEEKVTFEEVYLKKLDVERIKIISYVSAQSVALNRYEDSIDERLKELGAVVENLRKSGRTRFSQKNLLKQVGRVLSVKQNVVSNLALVDKPEEAWESEGIAKLYGKMRIQYELGERFKILDDKIAFLSENNTALLDFVSTQKGNFLELVIIILIALEIVLLAPDYLPFFKNLIF